MNHAAGVIVPELLPPPDVPVVDIVAFTLIARGSRAGPIFLQHAVPEDQLCFAGLLRGLSSFLRTFGCLRRFERENTEAGAHTHLKFRVVSQ